MKSSMREKQRPMAETWNSGFSVTRGLSHPERRRWSSLGRIQSLVKIGREKLDKAMSLSQQRPKMGRG